MKTHKAVLALSLAAMVAGLLSPVAVLAAGPARGQGGGRPHGGQHVTGPGPSHVPPHQHRQFHRPFVPRAYPRFSYVSPYFYGSSFGYGYGSSGGYDPPLAYPSPPAYPPPAAYAPPLAYAPPPAYPSAPPVPFSTTTVVTAPTRSSVIEFPTGKYELRGDGTSTPYAWVWIPNPPPPPPSVPEWPASGRADASPAPSEAPSPRRTQLYRWVDEQGVIHLTDNPESVPAQYRKPAARAQGGAS